MGKVRKANVSGTLLLLLIASISFSGCSAHFYDFWRDTRTRLQATADENPDFKMRFLGVSSFLLEYGNTRVMVDGFITRPFAAVFHPIEPNLKLVADRLRKSGIAVKEQCTEPFSEGRRLNLAFALHGHYDHALDTPLIASLTGAKLVKDKVVAGIAEQTNKGFPDLCPVDETVDLCEADDGACKPSKKPGVNGYPTFEQGDAKITLVPIPHSQNLASNALEATGSGEGWAFPAMAWHMKKGVSVAAHIKLGNRALLIVPTAGNIQAEFSDPRFHADVVFLGIGGAGWKRRDDLESYWHNVVLATGARRVIPVHWDRHSPPLSEDAPEPPIPFYEFHDRTLFWMRKFARRDQIEILSVPTLSSFDPFEGLRKGT